MRETCYRCFWPKPLCWCGSIVPMPTRTRFVFLMHPKEFKQEKAATGRLTHLCLPNSAVHMGIAFDDHAEVQALLAAPGNYPVLLYPGREAFNLSVAAPAALADFSRTLGARTLVVILLDATWALGRKMLKLSPSLQRLPRIMFTPAAPSRYVIKQQPHEGCLSTLEAVHELLLALDRTALDTYPDPAQLLALFDRMQQFQLRCAADPDRPGYRRRAYTAPAARAKPQGVSGARRTKVFQAPPAPPLSVPSSDPPPPDCAPPLS
jgi:DTW domain-containing protein YfiP